MEKPFIQHFIENDWEFVYPKSIDNEKVYNQYWEGVELLDFDDLEAERIFKNIISKHPYYIDAYNHLSIAFRNQNKTFESLLTAEKSYNLGKECFPKEFNFKTDKIIWSVLNNRPFLRACQTYGLECQYHKDYSKAIEIYKENLNLNKSDNQGIRYLLLEVYFMTNDFKQARQLIKKNSDDWSMEFKFGLVTLEAIEGNFTKADENLKEAIKRNKFFIDEVIKDKHIAPPPFRIPGEPNFDAGIPIGSIQEAFDYWTRNKELYKTKKVIEYYKDRKKNLCK
jgi:tetratricopeptide (TPR) repeat protein